MQSPDPTQSRPTQAGRPAVTPALNLDPHSNSLPSRSPTPEPQRSGATLPELESGVKRSFYVGRFIGGAKVFKTNVWLEDTLLLRLREAIRHLEEPVNAREFEFTYKFDRIIGVDDVVRREPQDKITYVRLTGSKNFVPTVAGVVGDRLLTKSISFALRRGNGGAWYLLVCHYGDVSGPSPTDRRVRNNPTELAASKAFWNDHAICRESLEKRGRIIPGSEQQQCPW